MWVVHSIVCARRRLQLGVPSAEDAARCVLSCVAKPSPNGRRSIGGSNLSMHALIVKYPYNYPLLKAAGPRGGSEDEEDE